MSSLTFFTAFFSFSLLTHVTSVPLISRQAPVDNSTTSTFALIAECAPVPFEVSQFSTFTGSASEQPYVAFFLESVNVESATGVTTQCRADFPYNASVTGGGFYGCHVSLTWVGNLSELTVSELDGTMFQYTDDLVLTVAQSIVCNAIYEGAAAWVYAASTIETTTVNGTLGGIYTSSIDDPTYLDAYTVNQSYPDVSSDLPTCGQQCLTYEIGLSPSMGCAVGDTTCLCSVQDFATALVGCLEQYCPSEAEAQEVEDYVNLFCLKKGVTPAVGLSLGVGGSSSAACENEQQGCGTA